MNFLFVALGGALGASGRYAISLIPLRSQFPFLTLLTNLFGAVLIGFVVGIAESRGASKNAVLFWKTGVWRRIHDLFDLLIGSLCASGEQVLWALRIVYRAERHRLHCRGLLREEGREFSVSRRRCLRKVWCFTRFIPRKM